MAEGFAELAELAGTSATFAGSTMQVVISSPNPGQQQVDIAMGRPYVVRVEVLRSELPTPRPQIGESLDIGGIMHAITDILKHDVTDPTVVYICKTNGKP